MSMSRKTWDELEKNITGDPCSLLGIMHTMLSKEIEEQIETEELGGPFDEEWIKDMQLKKEVKDTFEKLVERCKERQEEIKREEMKLAEVSIPVQRMVERKQAIQRGKIQRAKEERKEPKIQVAKEMGGFKSYTEKEFIDTFSPKVDKPPKKPPYVKA